MAPEPTIGESQNQQYRQADEGLHFLNKEEKNRQSSITLGEPSLTSLRFKKTSIDHVLRRGLFCSRKQIES